MARAYSGVLASIALTIVILRGLLTGVLPDEILTQCLAVFTGFAAVGYCIGLMAEQTVCDSVENRFRREMARLQSAAASKSTENLE